MLISFILDPYIINVHPLETDYLYPNLNDCPKLNFMRAFVKNNLDLYQKNSEYLDALKLLKSRFKIDESDNPFVFNEFLDDFHSRKAHNIFIPDDLNDILQKASKFAFKEMITEMK